MTTSLFIAGDVVNYTKLDGEICSADLEHIVSAADYAVCNFEAPVVGYGSPQPKSGSHHAQRAETVSGLQRQGFKLLLLANNHMMDYGAEGLKHTIECAERFGLDTLGAGLDFAQAYAPLIKNINGLRVGFFNACEAQFGVIDHFERQSTAGYAWINHPSTDLAILKLRRECDFVLVFAHAGLEHYSIPQKEWRVRYRHLCDLGADVVIGSHPHVPQGCERYNEALIFYSLGNFYFDSTEYIDKEDHSYSVLLKLEKGSAPAFEPVYHYKHQGRVRLAPQDKRIDLDDLSSLLTTGYREAHDEMSLQAYARIRPRLLQSLLPIPYRGTLLGSLKHLVRTLLGRNKHFDKTLLQLHLLRNEAYYYAARHALEVQVSRKRDGLEVAQPIKTGG